MSDFGAEIDTIIGAFPGGGAFRRAKVGKRPAPDAEQRVLRELLADAVNERDVRPPRYLLDLHPRNIPPTLTETTSASRADAHRGLLDAWHSHLASGADTDIDEVLRDKARHVVVADRVIVAVPVAEAV